MVLSFYIYCKKYCPRRVLAASRNYTYFVKNGLIPVDNLKKADLIVIHSCGGFNLDEEFSLLTLENALKKKSTSSKVIMTGCLPKINKGALSQFEEALIIPTEELSILDSIIDAKIPYNSIPESSIIRDVNDLYHGTPIKRIRRKLGFNRYFLTILSYLRKKLDFKTRNSYFDEGTYKIVISDGCVGNCTYCAIKFAMPKYTSIPEKQIVEKFRTGLQHNFKSFALTGADIGSYGIDINTNLPNLLDRLFAVEGDYKIILIDLNVRWLIKEYKSLFSVLKKNEEKLHTIIIPIQSGSDKILRLMQRHYKIGEVKKCLSDFQENIPNINIATHIMVGFPGETESDFQMSLDLLKNLNFSHIQIYKYEDRPGTAASKLPDKLPPKIIDKRAKMLSKMKNATICN